MAGGHRLGGDLAYRDGLVAGSVGGILGGVPSTLHAVATRGDPLESTLAAGMILLPHEHRRVRLLVAGVLAHGCISLFWGIVLAAGPLRGRPVVSGSVAGLAIAALDLGVVGRRLPRIRRLALLPQVADHLLYGAAVGSVLARRRRGQHPDE